MSENPTQDTQDNVVANESDAQDTPVNGDMQPEVNTEAAQDAVNEATEGDTVETTEEEETDAPSVEELLLKDHKKKVLGKDRISKSQMESYRAFLTHDPETNEELNSPLEHPLITDVIGEYDTAMWGRIAKQGKSALGEKAKDVDDAYIDMWETWKDNQTNRPPKSHMWLKGVVAAALLIAESIGEMEQEQWTTPVAQPTEEEAVAAAEARESAEAKDEALAQDAAPESPEQEQPVEPETGPDSDTRDQEGHDEESPEEEQGEE